MKENIYEYHPNGMLKYELKFYDNGNKRYEQYYDEDGLDHNENTPDYQKWYENGFLHVKTFYIHGERHNICSPANIRYTKNGNIMFKDYCINDRYFSDKLNWQNKIKNI